ncbi:MAG: helix-turn-helix transcriptional regulator [Bdellovibrionaceae bacterium]|nr:helix-turn-helix transcriptional regulator [Pseudobdellovibrionaceae bacterium]
MNTKNLIGVESLESKYGPMAVGLFLKAIRESDDISQVDFAKKLKISRANLCDLEKERKLVSPERAAKFARILKVPELALIRLSLQDLLRAAHLNYQVQLKGA